MKTVEEIAKIAAEWWGEKVCHPKFDNGDPSSTGGMTMMMAMMCTKNVRSSEKQLFVEALAKKIIPELEKAGYDVILSVDYGPGRMLSEAAQEANIPTNNFPWKTTMWITKNHVAVRYGYRASHEYLHIDTVYCDRQIESQKKHILYCQNEANFSYYDNAEKRKERMVESGAEATKELKFYEDKKAELLASV